MLLKRYLIFFFISIRCIASAQTETVEIRGRIRDREDSSRYMYCFKVKLLFNDSLFSERECDSTGTFSFKVPKAFLKNHRTLVLASQDHERIGKLYQPTDCPYMHLGPKQYMNARPAELSYKPEARTYTVELFPAAVCVLPKWPCLRFMKNETGLVACDEFNADTTLLCLKHFLLRNSELVVEVIAHAWEERNAQNLSAARAGYIRRQLMAFGIDSARITAKGEGNRNPLVVTEVIRKAPTREEKEQLRSMNRRAELRIIAWDYDPVLRKRKEYIPSKKQGEADEE